MTVVLALLAVFVPASVTLVGYWFRQQSEKRLEQEQKQSKDRRSEEHTSELQSHVNLVCRLLLEKKKKKTKTQKKKLTIRAALRDGLARLSLQLVISNLLHTTLCAPASVAVAHI